jgi:hypothetical protein
VGGEKMKKILVITVLLLTVAMLAIPVMGAPATKIEGVTITVVSGPPVPDEPPRFVSDGTISHATGQSASGATVTLYIPGVGTYEGDWHADWRANANWKKASEGMYQGVIPSKNTMTFPEGTFVGVNQRRITGISPFHPDAIIEDQGVYKGTGMFEGWTLKLTNNEGYLIIPK